MNFRFLLYISIFSLSALLNETSAQEVKTFHIDSTGRLYIKPGTPVYIYLSTSPDASNPVKLHRFQEGNDPISLSGHGFKQLKHLNLYLGRSIRFDIFADGKAPKTSLNFNANQGIQKGTTIYLSGDAVLEFSATDPFSGVQSILYSINDDEFSQYTNPIVFNNDGEYTIRFYSIDNVGNKEDVGERLILIDSTPPVTILSYNGPHHNGVVSSRTQFSLTATDTYGVKETFYSLNSNPETRYSRPITLTNLPEGEHTIKWYSVDMVGNVEVQQTLNFFVDRTPPMVFEEIIGNTYMIAGREYSSGRSQLRIAAVDNKAGVKEIYYSINNAPFKLYDKPIFLSEISGAITIRSYAIDNVENKGTSDAEGQQFSMPQVDITGPNIRHTFIGKHLTLRDTLWISPTTKININATDQGSGVSRIEYRINQNSAEVYSTPFSITQAGYYTLGLTAWDHVENLNIASFAVAVDAEAPEVFTHFSVKPHRFDDSEGKPLAVYPTGVTLFVGATDNLAGIDRIMISVNGARERAYTQPLDGFKATQTHSVTLRAIDKLGNERSKTITFKVE